MATATGLGGRDRSRDPRAKTDSKIFTAASTTFGGDLQHAHRPGGLQSARRAAVLNQKVLEYAVKAAMALNLNIAETWRPPAVLLRSPEELSDLPVRPADRRGGLDRGGGR